VNLELYTKRLGVNNEFLSGVIKVGHRTTSQDYGSFASPGLRILKSVDLTKYFVSSFLRMVTVKGQKNTRALRHIIK
jgi:hypothetical protein